MTIIINFFHKVLIIYVITFIERFEFAAISIKKLFDNFESQNFKFSIENEEFDIIRELFSVKEILLTIKELLK